MKSFYYKIETENKVRYNILLGLVSLTKNPDSSYLRLLGLPILIIKKTDFYKRICMIFFIVFKVKNHPKIIKKLYKIARKKGCDSVYLYKHHIGEIYLYLNMLDSFVKNNNSQKPLIVVNEKRYLPLYKMFLRKKYDIYECDISSQELDKIIKERFSKANIKFYNPTVNRFADLRADILEHKDVHFYNYIKNSLGLYEQNFVFTEGKVSKTVEERLLYKLECINLNYKKFVVFMPEAVTARLLSFDFWQNLADKFIDKGYDVFVNSRNGETGILGAKSISIGLEELYVMSKYSDGIIALINGAAVFLASSGVNMDAIYTNQTPSDFAMSAQEMIDGYTLFLIPYKSTANIREYNAETLDEKQLITEILKNYK